MRALGYRVPWVPCAWVLGLGPWGLRPKARPQSVGEFLPPPPLQGFTKRLCPGERPGLKLKWFGKDDGRRRFQPQLETLAVTVDGTGQKVAVPRKPPQRRNRTHAVAVSLQTGRHSITALAPFGALCVPDVVNRQIRSKSRHRPQSGHGNAFVLAADGDVPHAEGTRVDETANGDERSWRSVERPKQRVGFTNPGSTSTHGRSTPNQPRRQRSRRSSGP